MTVSLSFDKGLIDPPSSAERGFFWWVRNGALYLLAGALFAMTAFYYRAWNRYGRDPVKGPVFARYAAPTNYSPAGISHIHYKNVRGHKALIATLVSLAIKGYIDLDTDKKKTVISKLTPPPDAAPMNADETFLYQKIFKSRRQKIELKGKSNPCFLQGDNILCHAPLQALR